jgi:beta-exotoxin I transport system permease protein
MLLANPFTKALWDARRSIVGWGLTIGGIAVMYTAFYPSISKPSFAEALKNYPESIKKAFNMQDLTTPQGYLESYIFGLMVPILLAVFVIISGTRAIAGDEEAGTLDLILAHPVSRPGVLLSRLAALVTEVLIICGVVYVLLLAIAGPTKISPVGAGHIAAATIQLAFFGILFAALTLGVGAATGRRAAAIGTGVAVMVLGWFANSLAPQVHGLEWAQRLSPFHYYLGGQPLVNGFDPGGSAVLLGVAAVVVVAGLVRFRSRDLAV